MAAHLIVHHDFLHQVMKNKRKSLVEANTKQINILVEIVHNLLNSKNIPLNSREVTILRPVQKLLEALTKCRDVDKAREILFKLTKNQLCSFIVPAFVATNLRK